MLLAFFGEVKKPWPMIMEKAIMARGAPNPPFLLQARVIIMQAVFQIHALSKSSEISIHTHENTKKAVNYNNYHYSKCTQ